jgi:acyl-CoA-binding protein
MASARSCIVALLAPGALKITAARVHFHPAGDASMASLKSRFDKAVIESKKLPERPDNATLLKIYALYKQASEGDADGKRPGMTDFVGRAKYDAWAAVKGKAGNDAMQQYVDLIESLK